MLKRGGGLSTFPPFLLQRNPYQNFPSVDFWGRTPYFHPSPGVFWVTIVHKVLLKLMKVDKTIVKQVSPYPEGSLRGVKVVQREGREMKDELDSIRKYLPIVIHYGHSVILSLGTIIFGILLLINNRNNVIERVELFPQQTSLYFGMVMMFFGVLKLITVFKPNNRIKKWSLIGITLLWLIITWAYLVNPTQNTGSVMAATLSASCYVELWRGDFRDE